MTRKKIKKERPVFDSIRKPTAPASKKFTSEKTSERARPSGRKAKHKVKAQDEDEEP